MDRGGRGGWMQAIKKKAPPKMVGEAKKQVANIGDCASEIVLTRRGADVCCGHTG